MKKTVMFLLGLALAASAWSPARAANIIYADSGYAAQIGLDSFNYSVQKRLESVRLGSLGLNYASAPLIRSDGALAAPSSRTPARSSSVRGVSGRRQVDCVYDNGLTVWGDLYQTWASQSNNDGLGYRYRATAPAVGVDWTSGAFTFGAATTYIWGKLKGKDGDAGDLKTRTWGLEGYGQYNAERYYVSANLGYGYTHYKSPSTHSNDFNIAGEFGLKYNFSNLLVTPHAGLRVFHDRRGSFQDGVSEIGRESYYVWEMPLGVTAGYAIRAGGALIMPQVKFSWIPELARRRGDYPNQPAARRARNGFLLGAGLEAKITRSLSGHIDYAANLRNHAYEHHWNLGVGFTF